MLMLPDITVTAALAAGLLSFFSPCILPLVPSYFTFITGASLYDLTERQDRLIQRKVVISTLAFVLGFSIVFILLGATAAYFSNLIQSARPWLRIGGGILIIILGLHLTGIFRIRALEVEKRLQLKKKPLHFLGTLFIGMAFGAGWSPCIGPLLGSILILAGNQDTITQGIWLLLIYSLGLALPFIVLSICIHYLFEFMQRARRVIRYVNVVAGVLLVATGLLLVTDRLRWLSTL